MKTRGEDTAFVRRWMRPLLIGVLVGAAVCMLFLLLCAALLAAKDIPRAVIVPMAVTSAAIGSFAGGLVSARVAGVRGWLYGGLCGLILFVLVLAAGGFALLRDMHASYLAVKLAAMLLAATLGGMVGVNAGHGAHTSKRKR